MGCCWWSCGIEGLSMSKRKVLKNRKFFEKEFNNSQRKKWIIRIITKNPDGDNFDGIVLGNHEKFIVFQDFQDFEQRGIIFLPKKWIRGIRNGALEKSFNKICRFSRTLKLTKEKNKLLIRSSLKEVILQLKKNHIWPVVEMINKKSSSLYIGPITHVDDNLFKVYCYDATGKWEGNYKLEYRKLFKIEINGKYAHYFNKYMWAKMTRGKNGKRKI
jgi:hypothetical protein